MLRTLWSIIVVCFVRLITVMREGLLLPSHVGV